MCRKKIIKDKINIGVVGLGARGFSILKYCLQKMDDVNIAAVCDTNPALLNKAKKELKKSTNTIFTNDYKEVINAPGIQGILIMTGWEHHLKIAKECMKKNIYAGFEVGGIHSYDDLMSLIECYEKYKTPCMLLENCCYNDRELAVLNAVKKGVFGDIVYCSGGYRHDIRNELAYGLDKKHYRIHNYINHNCDNYTTHEIGPIAKVLDINNGNRFVSIYSTASKSLGLSEYIKSEKKIGNAIKEKNIIQGDIVTTVLKCENGEMVSIDLDTTLPRPYSRAFTVRGTQAMYQEDGEVFYKSKECKEIQIKKLYRTGKKFIKKYAHPITKIKDKSVLHGTMDWRVFRAFLESIRLKENTPIDIYDAVTWLAISYLSEISIKENKEIPFPDFTNGGYKYKKGTLKSDYRL